MIDKSEGRAYWIGASDTSYVVGNWNTASFKKWWMEKLDLRKSTLQTKAMKCGNAFEHKILEAIPEVTEMDKQIIHEELGLRVNLDGNSIDTIYEVKTHTKPFKVSKAYWRQAQVEMFAFGTEKLYIVSYQLTEEDYKNYFRPIDSDRLKLHKVEYDKDFIENEYLPKLKILKECMDKGVMPNAEHITR